MGNFDDERKILQAYADLLEAERREKEGGNPTRKQHPIKFFLSQHPDGLEFFADLDRTKNKPPKKQGKNLTL